MTSHRQTLVVMRHAKTRQQAATDRDRELTDRGAADSAAAGRWLVDQGLVPETVLLSSAVRARQTVEGLVEAFGHSPRLHALDDLYGADVDDVLALCAQVRVDEGPVMVVGHNPTMAELVHALQKGPEEPWAAHLPTAGLAILQVDDPWEALDRGSARLVSTHVGRG